LEVCEISAGIKATAKELKIPIIVLAQLNREPDKRKNGTPKLSDLRESGSIEQDADVVGLLCRPEYYCSDKNNIPADLQGLAIFDIAKQRNGGVGPINLRFVADLTRFENRDENERLYSNNSSFRQGGDDEDEDE
jgi:replicative DNA helicase